MRADKVSERLQIHLTVDFITKLLLVAGKNQTDGAVHKLKPRSFHKSAHLQIHSADFHPSVNCT